MKKSTKQKIKKIVMYVGGVTCVATAAYVLGHKPKVVEPCWRALHCSDGRLKVGFNSAMRANLQTVKQFIFHGQICNSYQVGNKFYTGHIPNALIKSINPLNGFK